MGYQMGFGAAHARVRNAAATRTAILNAARDRFSRESYDDVGLRDIAGDVGVDAALIPRYFGSKEELFSAALDSCRGRDDVIGGARSDFGCRVAQELVFGDRQDCKFDGLLMVLRSISSAKAAEIVRATANQRFHAPLSDWIGGPDAGIRAHLVAGLIKGIALTREINDDFDLTPDEREQLRDRLAATLQAMIRD